MGGKTTTIATEEPRLGNLRVQTSSSELIDSRRRQVDLRSAITRNSIAQQEMEFLFAPLPCLAVPP